MKKPIVVLSIELLCFLIFVCSANGFKPYPTSKHIKNIIWHKSTYFSAAEGSDLFPTTWAADDNIYTAWGDGRGFGFKKLKKRSFGVSVVKGIPPEIKFNDIYLGPKGSGKGKIVDILALPRTIYGIFNLQNGKWPDVNYKLIWSDDFGKNWQHSTWSWASQLGDFEPRKFLHAGRSYIDGKNDYVYIYGRRLKDPKNFYLARSQKDKILCQYCYEYFMGIGNRGIPQWTANASNMKPVFTDESISEFELNSFCVSYNKGISRYLAVTSHGDAGQIGIFDSATPWGPWSTSAYYENWLGMSGGVFLSLTFPAKWIDNAGINLWAIFSVHRYPEPPIYHDKFNLLKVTLIMK